MSGDGGQRGIDEALRDFQGMRLVLGGCCPVLGLASGDRDRGLLGERRMGRPFYD